MSFDPRKALEGVINTLKGKDPTLWQILRLLQQISNKNSDDISFIKNLASVQVKLQVETPTIANDICPYWPILILPVNRAGNTQFTTGYVSQVIIDAKTVPTGGDAVFDLLYSSDGGVTFATLFQGISFVLPKNIQAISYGNMTTKTFKQGTIFRLDCSVLHGVAGVEVTIFAVPQV